MKYTTRQVKITTSCICFDVVFCLLRGVLQALRQKYRKLSRKISSQSLLRLLVIIWASLRENRTLFCVKYSFE